MKIDQYKCEDCQAEFELLEGNTVEVKCIACESKKVQKTASKEFEGGGCDCSSCPGCGH
ncbi:zinc ribbon domain-containing protein [candidate division WS5 bacterium]|uniref:Zinc ribbon domain-containing protein n=1 Tax=candidate division WS5 bacterium TaxID=2093353 RepID=A0A419DAR0_9BACT|nr:MAG: zinc ribbon domain-containing protein [candidate division WS5 bacterium]